MDKEEINRTIEQLRQASIAAVQSGDFTRGVGLANAARLLTDWLNQGMRGQVPVDVETLLPGSTWPRSVRHSVGMQASPQQAPPAASEPPAREQPPTTPGAGPVGVAYNAETGAASVSGQADQGLAAAQKKADAGDYIGALADLEQAHRDAPAIQQERVAATIAGVQESRQQRVRDLARQAGRIAKEQAGNLAAQRAAWERVLELEPDNREAVEALNQLAQREIEERQGRELLKLRAPLQALRKDLREVEAARNRASQLRLSDEIRDPELRRQLDGVYNQLDELRNQILRASEGGASNERSQNYEAAIQKYSDAVNAGYDIIKDDVTGDMIDVTEALRRARTHYWADLRRRAGTRQQDALAALESGYPETAVARLEEAYELAKKIQEGGDEDRRNIENDLGRAREARNSKKEAQRLVAEAESDTDPEKARAKLMQAKQIYPSYPRLDDDYIKPKDGLVLSKAIQDMVSDLSAAVGAMRRAWERDDEEEGHGEFDRAREYCRIAANRGANLTVSNPEREARRQEAQKLLDAINQREDAYNRLMGLLRGIDRAVRERDVRLANALIADMSEEDRKDRRVQVLRIRAAHFKDDDQKMAEVNRFFYQDANYEGVMEICKTVESPAYRDEARKYSWRAQARLSLSQAHAAYQSGRLEQAIQGFQQVELLKRELPPEDHGLCQEAETARKQAELERRSAGELRQRLADASILRSQTLYSTQKLGQQMTTDWSSWLKRIDALRKEAPVWLKAEVEREYDEGKGDWAQQAAQLAEGQEARGEIHLAFDTLAPLAAQGLLLATDPVWRRIQYAHYKAYAEEALAGAQLEDWEKAESLAEQSRHAAQADQARAANEFLYETIRQATLKRAALAGATSNPGPEGAIRILEDKMKQYPALTMDAQVRGRLLRYCLDMGDFVKAADLAQTMAYVAREESWSAQWQQLVQVAQRAAEGQHTLAVSRLIESRRRVTADASQTLRETYGYLSQKLLNQLRQVVRPDTLSLSNEELVRQIQALEHIRQLDPADTESEQQIRYLANRLHGLVEPLRKQADQLSLRSGDSLQQTLVKGQTLLGEIRVVLHALEISDGGSGLVDLLRRAEERVHSQVEEWHLADDALRQMDERWGKVIGGAWDTKSLDEYLEIARQAGEVKEVVHWDGRITTLKECLNGTRRDPGDKGLRELIASIKKAWKDENFELLAGKRERGLIDELKNKLMQTCSALDESRFVIPQNELDFLDEFSNQRLSGLDALRSVAPVKLKNLDEWEAWQADFDALRSRVEQSWNQVEQWLTDSPPCLSEAKKLLGPMEQSIRALRDKAGEQPQTALSYRAKGIADRYPRAALDEGFDRLLKETDHRQRKLAEMQSAAEVPLRRLDDFRKGKRPLSSERNRMDLRKIVEDLRAIDACHESVAEFEKILARFGR